MECAFDSNIINVRVRKIISLAWLLFFCFSFNSVCYGLGNRLKCSGTIEDPIECYDSGAYKKEGPLDRVVQAVKNFAVRLGSAFFAALFFFFILKLFPIPKTVRLIAWILTVLTLIYYVFNG